MDDICLEKEKGRGANSYLVTARGFSIHKIIASLLYDRYSIQRKDQVGEEEVKSDTSKVSTCSPYLIFIINFEETDYQALMLNLKWLETHDTRRTKTKPIKVTMLTAKDLLKRNDLYLKGKLSISPQF